MVPTGWPSPDGRCTDALHRLYHYLDGELDDARRTTIQRHLDDCLPCLEAFGFEADLRGLVARKCVDQVPNGLRLRVAQALEQESGSRFRRRRGMLR